LVIKTQVLVRAVTTFMQIVSPGEFCAGKAIDALSNKREIFLFAASLLLVPIWYVRFEVFTPVTMKNVVFWDIKTQFVPHSTQVTSPLQSPAS
jgi:hypothetical protein